MSDKPVALFDLDGTLADYDGQLRADLEKMRSPDEDEITTKGMYGDLEPWLEERIRVIKRQPDWWANLPCFKLGWDILEAARPLFAIHILSKGPSSNPDAWRQKAEWVRKNLDDTVLIHLTESKGIHYGRVLVDDYPKYITEWLKYRPRGLVIMPTNVGNRDFRHPDVIPYDGYNLAEVEEVLRAAAERKDGCHWKDILPPL